jgi:hypothetical protein
MLGGVRANVGNVTVSEVRVWAFTVDSGLDLSRESRIVLTQSHKRQFKCHGFASCGIIPDLVRFVRSFRSERTVHVQQFASVLVGKAPLVSLDLLVPVSLVPKLVLTRVSRVCFLFQYGRFLRIRMQSIRSLVAALLLLTVGFSHAQQRLNEYKVRAYVYDFR